MMRSILHVDMNNFYASVECLYRPEIRNKPVAVTGDVENRHGIVLAKNMIAKKMGVTTGEHLAAKIKHLTSFVFRPITANTCVFPVLHATFYIIILTG